MLFGAVKVATNTMFDYKRNVIISSSIKSLNRLYGFHKILSGLGEAGVQSQPQRGTKYLGGFEFCAKAD